MKKHGEKSARRICRHKPVVVKWRNTGEASYHLLDAPKRLKMGIVGSGGGGDRNILYNWNDHDIPTQNNKLLAGLEYFLNGNAVAETEREPRRLRLRWRRHGRYEELADG